MEPLTTIELRTCKWLGVIALACSAVAELLRLAHDTGSAKSPATRETARRAMSRGSARTR